MSQLSKRLNLLDRYLTLWIFLAMGLMLTACSERGKVSEKSDQIAPIKPAETVNQSPVAVSLPVTFVELGSVNCIPCKKMQPVMKAIEETYAGVVTVVFYDVWQEEQKHFAEDYDIRIIPTQVFMDGEGREFFRHEGYYPEKEIAAMLAEYGVQPPVQ